MDGTAVKKKGLHILYFPSKVIRLVKSSRMILAEKPEGKRPFGKPSQRWVMILK